MKPRLLQHGPLMASLEAGWPRHSTCNRCRRTPTEGGFSPARRRVTALATSAAFGADRALIEALPSLRVIASFGVGVEKIDLAAARERGVAVSNTPERADGCGADLAFGLLIDGVAAAVGGEPLRRRATGRRARFRWRARVGKATRHRRLGRIGSAIARRAGGFDMPVALSHRRPVENCPYSSRRLCLRLPRGRTSGDRCAGGAPPATCLAPGDDALGPGGFLVNVRAAAWSTRRRCSKPCRHRRIAGAALDVFEDEPKSRGAVRTRQVSCCRTSPARRHENAAGDGDSVLANLRSFSTAAGCDAVA